MLAAARFVGEESRLPTPLEAGVYHKALDEETIQNRKSVLKAHHFSMDSKMAVSFEGATSYECLLKDLMKILHYIFDLLVNDLQIPSFTLWFYGNSKYLYLNRQY